MNDAIELVTKYLPPWLPILLAIHFSVLGLVAYLILLERKVASYAQDRLGPNRVGFDFGLPFLSWLKGLKGLGQPLADGLKFILKEDYRAKNVDKILFTIAPIIMIVVIIVSVAVVPFGGIKQSKGTVAIDNATNMADPEAVEAAAANELPWGARLVSVSEPYSRPAVLGADGSIVKPQKTVVDATYHWDFQIARLDVGILFVLGILSLAVYGIVVGGWASNNKYSFLGGLRATAGMISYEVPLGIAALTIVVMFGTLDLTEIVDKQAFMWGGIVPAWNVFVQPLAFIIFLVCIHAEANRAPFDLAECEAELVGGYHTEYSSMRFAMFFLAEYAGMVTTAAICVALFFGGWHLPFVDKIWPQFAGGVSPAVPSLTESLIVCVVRTGIVFGKTVLILFVFMWVRWSLPRFRFDQLMNLSWRGMIPVSLVMLMATAFGVWWWGGDGRAHMRIGGKMALFLFGINVACLGIIMFGSRMIPAGPDINRKLKVANSRFARTPLPASVN